MAYWAGQCKGKVHPERNEQPMPRIEYSPEDFLKIGGKSDTFQKYVEETKKEKYTDEDIKECRAREVENVPVRHVRGHKYGNGYSTRHYGRSEDWL